MPTLTSFDFRYSQGRAYGEAARVIDVIGFGNFAPRARVGVHVGCDTIEAIPAPDYSCCEFGIGLTQVFFSVLAPAQKLCKRDGDVSPERRTAAVEKSKFLLQAADHPCERKIRVAKTAASPEN